MSSRQPTDVRASLEAFARHGGLEGRVPAPLPERLDVVAQFAAALRALGPANFLYSDGDALFIHGHKRRHRAAAPAAPPGLHLLCRRCAPGQHLVLAASVPLTSEPGELIVAQGGSIVARCGLPAQALAIS